MKVLIYLSLVFVLVSCFGSNLEVGNCIQKPDESSVWKIKSMNDGMAQLIRSEKGTSTQELEVSLPGSYIKTKCRY